MIKKAILFPAFVRAYSGMERLFIENHFPDFKSSLDVASEITGSDLSDFDFEKNNFLDDELKSQYISFIFSCRLADLLYKSGIKFNYSAGYSMGIYAMYHYTGSISLVNGLNLIKKAYELVSTSVAANSFGMGNIIGLNLADVTAIIWDEDAEIININGNHNFVVSGKLSAIQNILEKATIEGAIRVGMLPVGCPYHTKYLKDSAVDFGNYINGIEIFPPLIPVISGINQKEISNETEIRMEFINNLYTALNWQDTIVKMNENGVELFYECGAGDSLSKLNKFIPGNHKTLKFQFADKLSNF